MSENGSSRTPVILAQSGRAVEHPSNQRLPAQIETSGEQQGAQVRHIYLEKHLKSLLLQLAIQPCDKCQVKPTKASQWEPDLFRRIIHRHLNSRRLRCPCIKFKKRCTSIVVGVSRYLVLNKLCNQRHWAMIPKTKQIQN